MNESHMRRAIALAREHMLAGHGGPFGAIVVHGEQVIAEGWNMVTSTNDPTAHAEVTAIRKASQALGTFELHDCVLYTSCEPCPMCLAAIYWARIPKVYYAADRHAAAAAGFSDAEIYEQIPLPIEQRSVHMQQLLGGEGQSPFAAWLAKDDRVDY